MSTAFGAADILLPDLEDMSVWSAVACDQYTSQPEYWKEAENLAGDNPSSLKLILPEVYLKSKDVDSRIEKIHENMKKYLSGGLFREYPCSMIYVERMTSDGMRAGIVGAVDLEEYDYHKGSTSLIRATEATVTERIPPRVKIRSGAPLELSHIMMLIDDAEMKVIEPLGAKKQSMEKLYDFELMMGGGHITGYLMGKDEIARVEKALEALGDAGAFNAKYGFDNTPVLLYAMGDGNHSLASAKEFYERLKAENPEKDMTSHPARYALCELVNLHCDALRFEAIHRVVTGVDTHKLKKAMEKELELTDKENALQHFVIVNGREEQRVFINNPSSNLAVGSLQNFLDKYIAENGGSVDYIHGSEVVRKLSEAEDSVGFLLPDMAKEELFPSVIRDGALPRKTFSMGHAEDKRFYNECRKIVNS